MKSFVRVGLMLAMAAFMLINSGCGYNSIQAKEEQVFAKWADVEAAYQRRADLIPSLVEVVKGYAAHEKETFTQVAQARASVGQIKLDPKGLQDAAQMAKFQAQQQTIGSALSRLMMVTEKYPDLKANESFMNLQSQLEGTENRINTERVRYNKVVAEFNTMIRTFPNSITNSLLLNLEKKTPFKSDEGAKIAPKVSFSGAAPSNNKP